MPTIYVAVNNGAWIDPETWEPAGIPSESDEVVVPANMTVPYCGPGIARCKSLTTYPQPKPRRGRRK